MAKKQRCDACDRYEEQVHNYCRMCGYHLTKGWVQKLRQLVLWATNEKHCGYCGKTRAECECA